MKHSRGKKMPRAIKSQSGKRLNESQIRGPRNFARNPHRKQARKQAMNFFLGDDGTIYYQDRHER